jgi:hypothetical protein
VKKRNLPQSAASAGGYFTEAASVMR